jgi:L,D-transpeptidase catalytic domain
MLSLGDPIAESELGGGSEAPPTEPESPPNAPAVPTDADARANPDAGAENASSRGGSSGLKALDAWHRTMVEGRADVLDLCDGDSAAALADLDRAMQGESKAYRALLRLEVPQALGTEFARYAQAYADGDVEQLATVLRPTPEPTPAWMVWTETLARFAMDQENDRVGGPALGNLTQAMLNLGYSRDLVLKLRPLSESLARRSGDSMDYTVYEVQSGETLYDVRAKQRKLGLMLNYRWIADFNDKSGYGLRIDEELKIPKQELHVEIWRGARVTVVFAGERPIRIYPASVGREGQETPLGEFTLGICEQKPVYYGVTPPVPFGNPENPLGERWLGFSEKTSYGIHGTNSETTIGSRESEGCVRMHNQDVVDLFDLVPTGTRVKIHP